MQLCTLDFKTLFGVEFWSRLANSKKMCVYFLFSTYCDGTYKETSLHCPQECVRMSDSPHILWPQTSARKVI